METVTANLVTAEFKKISTTKDKFADDIKGTTNKATKLGTRSTRTT